jgi:shikimate kinase
MTHAKVFLLLGFRGVGKTTLGKKAAALLGYDFTDLDEVFCARFQTTIPAYIESNGLTAFREKELECAQEAFAKAESQARAVILSSGGGLVDFEPSREWLGSCTAKKIYLVNDPKVIWQRLSKKPARLQIGGLHSEADLLALYSARAPFYQALADIEINLDGMSITDAVDALASAIAKH